jgi:hypothetical protein
VTRSAILDIQARAIAANDHELRHACWAALGYDSRVAFMPATPWQVERGLEACTRAMERAS